MTYTINKPPALGLLQANDGPMGHTGANSAWPNDGLQQASSSAAGLSCLGQNSGLSLVQNARDPTQAYFLRICFLSLIWSGRRCIILCKSFQILCSNHLESAAVCHLQGVDARLP